MQPSFPPESAPLEVDRVEWVPASPEAVHVHVLGRWRDRPVAEPLVLLVGSESGRRDPFAALEAAPPGVLAAFAVPNELRARLSADIALLVGSTELELPAAQTGAVAQEGDEPEAEVIDRAVLAERRARRAELAEESLARRAAEAEKTTGTLEAQLGNLEERLAQARDERDELEAALSDAERRLKAAQQREYAEQQQRIEAQDEVERVRREQQHEVAHLRRRLEAANQRAEDMAREVDRARRGIAEAEVSNLARELETALAGEQDARAAAERALAAAREEAAAKVTLLEHELESRIGVAARVAEQVRELRAELEAVRAQVVDQARTARSVSSLNEIADRLKDRVVALEGRKDAAEAELGRTQQILSDRTVELERARIDLQRAQRDAEASLHELRDEVDAERAARRAAERQLGEERGAVAAAMARLAREQARREELEQQVTEALEAVRRVREEDEARGARDAAVQRLVGEVLGTAAALRAAFEEESRKLEGELTAVVVEERRRMAEELQAMEARAEDLQSQVDDAGAALRAELQAERQARWLAEAELARERQRQRHGAPREQAPERAAVEHELRGLRGDLERVQRVAADPTPQSSEAHAVIADLDNAAERLREQVPPPEEAPEQPGTPLASRLVGVGARPTVPWLSEAIVRLAERDPGAAARLVVGLLPVQRLLAASDATYDLTVTELGTFRVQLHAGATTVDPRVEPGPRKEIDFHLQGSAASLAGFAAGGAPRRLKDTHFEGSRRRLRKLLKELRDPIGLAELARSGAAIEPGLILAALAEATDPVLAVGHTFTVAWAVSGRRGGTWTVHVAGAPLRVEPGVPQEGATATVHVPQAVFLPLLAGFAPPPGQQATVTGNAHAVGLLRQWFAAAQGLP